MKIIIENENDYKMAKITERHIDTIENTLKNICEYDSRLTTLYILKGEIQRAIWETEQDAPF